jgi:hypothetical protein
MQMIQHERTSLNGHVKVLKDVLIIDMCTRIVHHPRSPCINMTPLSNSVKWSEVVCRLQISDQRKPLSARDHAQQAHATIHPNHAMHAITFWGVNIIYV